MGNGRLSDRIFKSKYFGVITIGAAIAAALIIILSGSSGDKKNKNEEKTFDEFEYTENIENKIKNVVKNINGAGRTTVMVSIENTYETCYASDNSSASQDSEKSGESTENAQSSSSEKSHVILQSDNGESGLEVTKIMPSISGVLIVCEGGGDEYIKEQIKTAVSTVLNISEQKVCVLESKR